MEVVQLTRSAPLASTQWYGPSNYGAQVTTPPAQKEKKHIDIGGHILSYFSLRIKVLVWVVISPHISLGMKVLRECWDMERGDFGTGVTVGRLPYLILPVHCHKHFFTKGYRIHSPALELYDIYLSIPPNPQLEGRDSFLLNFLNFKLLSQHLSCDKSGINVLCWIIHYHKPSDLKQCPFIILPFL